MFIDFFTPLNDLQFAKEWKINETEKNTKNCIVQIKYSSEISKTWMRFVKRNKSKGK